MIQNIGTVDRVIRIIVGVAILIAGYHYQSWWGLIGLLPALTAVVRFCPGYLPFGINTCGAKNPPPATPRSDAA